MHLFCPIVIPNAKVESSEEAPQFGFDCGLIDHCLANARGRPVQNIPQLGGITTESDGRAHALEHVFEEQGDLLTLGSFGLSLLLSIVRLSTGLPLPGEGCGNNNQACDEKHRDDPYPDKEQFVAEHYFLKSVELTRGTRQNGLLGQKPSNVERK